MDKTTTLSLHLAAAVLLLTALFVPRHATANVPPPATTYFKVINTGAGLPDNSVNDIAEDRFGFLWVATWNGLARYDGKNIVTFRHRDNSPSLSNNMVRSLLPDENGIWVASDAGVDFLRYSDSNFLPSKVLTSAGDTAPLNTRISRLIKRGERVFALTSGGDLMRLERKMSENDGTQNFFRTMPKPLTRTYADLTPYTRGRILALSDEGITLLSSDGERELMHYSRKAIFDNNMNLHCDTVTGIVIAGGGIGYHTDAYRIDESAGTLIPAGDMHVTDGLMCATNADGTLYMASDGKGLFAIDSDGRTVNYTPKNSSLPADAIYTVYADSRGNIWCGTYRHGLCLLSQELNSYTVNNIASGSLSYDIVTAIAPADNKIYIGLDGGGIDIYDKATGRSKNFNSSNSDLPGNNVVSLVNDGTTLWAAVYSGGLSALDLATHNITNYRIDTGYEPGNKLWVLAEDDKGNLWVGGRALHVFNKVNKKFTPVEGCDNIMAMSIINYGNYMWVGTRFKGILQIDKRTRRVVERFSDSPTTGGALLPGHQVEFIGIDPMGVVWADLGSKGVCSIDTRNDNEVRMFSQDQFGKERMRSMIPDDDNNLWVGTEGGLYKYMRANGTLVRKNDSRLPMSYTNNAAARRGDTVFFGTTTGLLSFSLSDTARDLHSPGTLFTEIEIFDSQHTTIPLYSTGETNVVLENSQNFFKVSFSAPEMSNPEQLKFECRLEGLEDIWRDASEERSATYTNVPAGKYRLLVRHSNPDGTWAGITALGIKVKTAWYAAWWTRLLWFILVVGLITFGLYFWRKYIINQEKAILAEIERDSQKRLNEAKLDFYANVTHELRTPCFLISAQIEEIVDSERQTIPVSALSGIYRNSAKLNKLINHILDFRKNESGHLRLDARHIELVKFLGDLTPEYEQLCRQKAISFTYTHDEAPIEADIDPDKLEQIVTNLISNAYKYTPKAGSVALSVRNLDDTVAISVSDTGIGIVDKLHTAIFEPFVRTERGRSQSKGDGIGLAFVKELIELHGGTITLDSAVNEGSTFTVFLPKVHGGVVNVPDDSETRPAMTMPAPVEPAIRPHDLVANPTATHAILLVDDDSEVTALIAGAFADDYRVQRASNGIEALEAIKANNFDVVITDIMMPESDGHTLLRAIKDDPELRSIKVVVFSAMTGEEDMLKAFDEGADAYLTKPTPLKVLRRQVERLFEVPEELGSIATTYSSGAYNREEQKFLLRCRQVIDECLAEENFSIEILAGKLAMSHSSLYKKIKRMTGLSLIDFINEYRICKAVSMFNDGNTNVQKVSEMCGFRDIKSFRESFKKKMNIAPKQFILQLGKAAKDDKKEKEDEA